MDYLVINIKDGALQSIERYENRTVAYSKHDKVELEPGLRSYLVTVLSDRYGGDRNAPLVIDEGKTTTEDAVVAKDEAVATVTVRKVK